MIIAGVMEWILGNTFTLVVLASFGMRNSPSLYCSRKQRPNRIDYSKGGFWLSLATTLVPAYGAAAAFQPQDPTNPGFNSSFGTYCLPVYKSIRIHLTITTAFYYVFFGLLCFIYLICSLRTNLVFFLIFLALTLGFGLLAGANFQLADGAVALAGRLQIVSFPSRYFYPLFLHSPCAM